MASVSLVLPVMAIELIIISAAIIILFLLFSTANITITNAQQQQLEQQQLSTDQSGAIENRTKSLFQNIDDGFRVQAPEGWVIRDVNNTGSIFLEESTQGYGILAQLCPQQQQLSNVDNSSDAYSNHRCVEPEQEHIVHIVRYPDLYTRMQQAYNVTVNNGPTIDNILLYHIQKLQEVGYRNITIVNSTYTTVNITNAQTNQTISIVPAKTAEMTYKTSASASDEIRRGYFILTATNATYPNVGVTKGYSIFYEGTSTTVVPSGIQTSTLSSDLPDPPTAVRQVFDSFELIAAPEIVAQVGNIGQIEQAVSNQPDHLREEPTDEGEEDNDEEGGNGGNGGNDGDGELVALCHRPEGNPENAQTLRLPPNAAEAHLEQHEFDTRGPCPEDD